MSSSLCQNQGNHHYQRGPHPNRALGSHATSQVPVGRQIEKANMPKPHCLAQFGTTHGKISTIVDQPSWLRTSINWQKCSTRIPPPPFQRIVACQGQGGTGQANWAGYLCKVLGDFLSGASGGGRKSDIVLHGRHKACPGPAQALPHAISRKPRKSRRKNGQLLKLSRRQSRHSCWQTCNQAKSKRMCSGWMMTHLKRLLHRHMAMALRMPRIWRFRS